VADNDELAFAARYTEHAGHVTAFVLRRSRRDDAADIVSETFLVAWRRKDQIPSEPMTRAWLYGGARRVMANHRRALSVPYGAIGPMASPNGVVSTPGAKARLPV
jgi:RNA polymerase sigma-70 factor (ECF subfamily)